MSIPSTARGYIEKKAMNFAVRLLPRMSDDKALIYSRKHLGKDDCPETQEMLELMLLAFKHRLAEYSPNCRKRLAKSLLVNEILVGHRRRAEITAREGVNIPPLFVVSPTMRCNLHCYGCYSASYTRQDDLEPEVFNRILDEAEQLGIYFIVVSGGEPFIYKPLLDIFQRHSDIFFQVYTNGTFINREMAEKLGKLGNVLPCVSVEGFEEETDARRGKGHFEKVMAAMENLKQAGVPFGFSATATRENNELLSSEEFVDFYIKRGCTVGWYFNYVPIGRNPNLDLMPTPEQRDYRRRQLNELRRRKDIILADFWNDGPMTDGCIAGGKRYFHINNRGDVEPCVFAHFTVDNIHDKGLFELLRTSPLFKAIQARQPYGENLLCPCMIIDHPHVLREVVLESGARPSHPGAEKILDEFSAPLDEYGERYAEIADKAWREEYVSGRKQGREMAAVSD